jgi:hypothetical protein
MRKLQIIYIAAITILVCCKDRTYVSTGEIEAPTQEVLDSVGMALEEVTTAANETAPPELVIRAAEIKEEKEDSSPFRLEGCCDKEAPPAICCCEAVWLKYKEMLRSSEKDKIGEIRSTDPFLNKCYKLVPDFKSLIDSTEVD